MTLTWFLLCSSPSLSPTPGYHLSDIEMLRRNFGNAHPEGTPRRLRQTIRGKLRRPEYQPVCPMARLGRSLGTLSYITPFEQCILGWKRQEKSPLPRIFSQPGRTPRRDDGRAGSIRRLRRFSVIKLRSFGEDVAAYYPRAWTQYLPFTFHGQNSPTLDL